MNKVIIDIVYKFVTVSLIPQKNIIEGVVNVMNAASTFTVVISLTTELVG